MTGLLEATIIDAGGLRKHRIHRRHVINVEHELQYVS